MFTSEGWLIGSSLATIATWVMIIGVAVLLYTSRRPKRSSQRSKNK